MNHIITKEEIAGQLRQLQDHICTQLEYADGTGKFQEELWEREGGGGGRTRIIQHGSVIEKGGVNFSAVHGILPENVKKALKVDAADFFATGVSIVIHPKSPMVPIIHMNVRYFEMDENVWWFGGGIDLTPHYIIPEQAAWFHQQLKNTCDRFDTSYYPKFKKWADDYFFIKHRDETRGVGGVFFDRLTGEKEQKQHLFDFLLAVGNTFAPTYRHLMKANQDQPYNESQKQWQLLRRGRYVEFNLVYDKGTKFGLDTNGRIESILMSLPEQAGWYYNFQPQTGSEEEKTLQMLKKDIEWLSFI